MIERWSAAATWTLWLSPKAIATLGTRAQLARCGGQPKYSNLAIENGLTLRLLFHLPLRQTEGFLTSVFGIMGWTCPYRITRRSHDAVSLGSRAAGEFAHATVSISSWTARASIVVKGSGPRRNTEEGHKRGWKKPISASIGQATSIAHA
jgi:hypothetical protein